MEPTRLSIKDCTFVWTTLQILADGTVRPCCWCNGNLGNLNDNTIEEIWNGELLASMRKSIENNEIHPICGVSAPCPYIQKIFKDPS